LITVSGPRASDEIVPVTVKRVPAPVVPVIVTAPLVPPVPAALTVAVSTLAGRMKGDGLPDDRRHLDGVFLQARKQGRKVGARCGENVHCVG
jgi:hypothetical protein